MFPWKNCYNISLTVYDITRILINNKKQDGVRIITIHIF